MAKRKRDYREIDKFSLWLSFDGLCGICSEPVSATTFTIDHIIPLNQGGKNKLKNLQPAHYECNQFKGDSMPWEERPKKRKRKLPYRNWSCYNKKRNGQVLAR